MALFDDLKDLMAATGANAVDPAIAAAVPVLEAMHGHRSPDHDAMGGVAGTVAGFAANAALGGPVLTERVNAVIAALDARYVLK
jgi:hypothetical protein